MYRFLLKTFVQVGTMYGGLANRLAEELQHATIFAVRIHLLIKLRVFIFLILLSIEICNWALLHKV
jgi:hypothetical protein